MISRQSRLIFAAVLLMCFGCTSTTGGRGWLGYLRYGSDDTPEEKAKSWETFQEVWGIEESETVTSSSPAGPTSPPSNGHQTPVNAFAGMIDNKLSGTWSVSRTLLGPERLSFAKGDKVRIKASTNARTMTVEYVPASIYVDARYYSESLKESFQRAMRYRCRWNNVDGSESVGEFREEELERVSVEG